MKKISHIVMMGDSLSDRGTANKDYIFGFIPLATSHDLANTSPRGRFTNGYVWSDVIGSMFASNFMVKKLKKKPHYSSEDIASDIITKDTKIMESLRTSYALDDDLYVTVDGRDFMRCYVEAGLSAYNYAWRLSSSIVRFFERIVLSTLAEKRKLLLTYDEAHKVSTKQKEETLVIEWTGANDLITVNVSPTTLEVDRAVAERILNIETLIKNGYRNFVLLNIPNLSLTPRFQNMPGPAGEGERANAEKCSLYFNEQLKQACERLQAKYPNCSVDLFDVNAFFTDAYTRPDIYKLDPEKLKKPYKASADFKMLPNKTSPAKGYMFWDDIHPSAYIHTLLAQAFYTKYNAQYQFSLSEDEELTQETVPASEKPNIHSAGRPSSIKQSFFEKLPSSTGLRRSSSQPVIAKRDASMEETIEPSIAGIQSI